MKVKSIKQALKDYGFVVHDVVGQSMLPLLKEGVNKVHLVIPQTLNLFDVVLYKGDKDNYILHRIIDINQNKLTILGDNNNYIEYKNTKDIIAKMEGYYEGVEYISVNNEKYLHYLNNVYPYYKKDNRISLLNNPKQYFLTRLENAYFELIKLEITGTLNKEVVNQLTPNEKTIFVQQMRYKKAIPYLSLAIKSFGVNLGEKLNSEVIKRNNELLNLTVKEEIAINQVSILFNAHSIAHIFLKGSETKKLYRYQELRTKNDIDILVKKSDFKKACEVMEKEFNISILCSTDHDVTYMLPNINVHIELHHSINQDLPKDIKYLLKEPFNEAYKIDNSYRYTLTNTQMLLHALYHSISHFKMCWHWITMLLDIYYLSKLDIDFDMIKQARLDTYYHAISNILHCALGNKILNQAEKYYLDLCFSDKSYIENVYSLAKHNSKLRYYLYRIFMPYKELSSYYKSLNKMPILYPIYLIIRAVRISFNKIARKNVKDDFDNFKVINKNEVNFLKEVGINEYMNSNS